MEKNRNVLIRLFGFSIFAYYIKGKFGWFRLFGRGIKWKRIDVHGLSFSERGGYKKYFMVGKLVISYLPLNGI